MTESLPTGTRLIDREHLRAELFRAADTPAKVLCVTFTERGHRDLAGTGFGGRLLLDDGIDVLAIKASVDHWYQPLKPGELSTLRQAASTYGQRAGYGSSMGGYAAIRFSSALKLHRVLALSPVLDIMPDWETRYPDDRAHVKGAMLPKGAIRESCRFFVAYDPADRLDVAQMRLLAEHLPLERIALLPVPRGGHPVGPALRDTGMLKPLVKSVIGRGRMPPGVVFRRVARDAGGLHTLAERCHASRRHALALEINERAIRLDPDWGEGYIQRCRFLWEAGRPQEAITAGRLAVVMLPDNPHVAGYLALIMRDDARPAEAFATVERALARLPGDAVLQDVRAQLAG